MKPEDVRKLLGGYATGTLTAAEQEALFAAALEDQELFEALLKEEPLREVLRDPGARAELLHALERPPVVARWWQWRPLVGAVAMAAVALAVVAVWRGTRQHPAPVMVAESIRQAPAQPALIEPAAPPAMQGKPNAEAKTRPVPREEQRTPAPESKAADSALGAGRNKGAIGAIAGDLKDEAPANTAAAPRPAAAAPPPLRPEVTQQTGQQFAAPSPMAQQSVAVQAAPMVNRAAATSGFRDANSVKEVAALEKKAEPLLQWSILRETAEAPPGAVLNTGEAVKLRIVSRAAGTLTLTDGDKVLATATVEPLRPFDTPPIPYTVPGPRPLLLTLSNTGGALPLTLTLTLQYAK